MASHTLYQMDREITPVPQLGALPLTPVTQGTDCLVILGEFVRIMDCGQTVSHLVIVS